MIRRAIIFNVTTYRVSCRPAIFPRRQAIRPFAYLSIAGNRRRQTIWAYVRSKLHEFIELMSCLMDPVLKYFVE